MAKTTHTQTVLEIDIAGFRETLQAKGKPRVMMEALSNALDPKGTTVVLVTFSQENGWATLTVKDNDPDGFKNLKDAYTLFAASERRGDPTARGRYGQGEKEIVALCTDGRYAALSIQSTTGTVDFSEAGRSESTQKTTMGTVLTAHYKMNKQEAAEFVTLVQAIIVPEGITFKFNDTVIERPAPVKAVKETLDTVYWDAEGQMHETRRQTDVELFEAHGPAWILELGIPVVEHDGRFHVNIGQKVPLSTSRDNVKPSYLRKLREVTLNATFDILTSVDQKSTWVKDVVATASDEAFDSVMEGIYGKNAVIMDPSNPEAVKRAYDQGRQVIGGRTLSTDMWDRMRERQTFKPAGQVIQTHVPTSPDGIPPIRRADWTPEMFQVEDYIHALGKHVLGFAPDVEYSMASTGQKRSSASWGGRTMTIYFRNVGRHFPKTVTQEALDALVIHEFTHHTQGDHFTDGFIRDIADIGAKLRSCPAKLSDYRS